MTATPITTRDAGTDDTDTVASLVHGLLVELAPEAGLAPEAVAGTAREVLAAGDVHAILAHDADLPVGVITLNACRAIYAGGAFGEISELYVLPAYRSRGVAPLLLAAASAKGRALGWGRLEVGAPHQPAWARTLAFYQREGFETVGPRLKKLL